jgi:hypothetical protein
MARASFFVCVHCASALVSVVAFVWIGFPRRIAWLRYSIRSCCCAVGFFTWRISFVLVPRQFHYSCFCGSLSVFARVIRIRFRLRSLYVFLVASSSMRTLTRYARVQILFFAFAVYAFSLRARAFGYLFRSLRT